jgi:hypothetical protein
MEMGKKPFFLSPIIFFTSFSVTGRKKTGPGGKILYCFSSNSYPRSCLGSSVPDPHVFGPPGSGSTSQRTRSGSRSCSGSGSSYHHAKNFIKKNLDSYNFVALVDFLSWKHYVNVPSKNNN